MVAAAERGITGLENQVNFEFAGVSNTALREFLEDFSSAIDPFLPEGGFPAKIVYQIPDGYRIFRASGPTSFKRDYNFIVARRIVKDLGWKEKKIQINREQLLALAAYYFFYKDLSWAEKRSQVKSLLWETREALGSSDLVGLFNDEPLLVRKPHGGRKKLISKREMAYSQLGNNNVVYRSMPVVDSRNLADIPLQERVLSKIPNLYRDDLKTAEEWSAARLRAIIPRQATVDEFPYSRLGIPDCIMKMLMFSVASFVKKTMLSFDPQLREVFVYQAQRAIQFCINRMESRVGYSNLREVFETDVARVKNLDFYQ